MDDSLRLDAQAARNEIQSGRLRGAALVQRVLSVPNHDRDEWVDEALGVPAPPPDVNLPRGAVPYLPASVEEILTMATEAPLRPDDELVDLGSGFGRVVMLANLLTGARARGIEIQAPLVDGARRCARELGLSDVSFVHGNAADVELSGSFFFLYSPFNGPMLTKVLGQLEQLARRRRILVCAVGLDFSGQPWLKQRPGTIPSLTLYDSVAVG